MASVTCSWLGRVNAKIASAVFNPPNSGGDCTADVPGDVGQGPKHWGCRADRRMCGEAAAHAGVIYGEARLTVRAPRANNI